MISLYDLLREKAKITNYQNQTLLNEIMSIKRTEVGVRDQLIKELENQLGKNFYISEECSIKHREHFIKWKGRDQPDILIFNKEFIKIEEENIEYEDVRAIVAVIDTKKFNEDITKDKHIGQLFRYMTDLNINHGFLTNLKDVASHHLTIQRLRKKKSCSDEKEVAKWIVDSITEYYGHLPAPISVERIIETLNESMETLMSYVKTENVEIWEEILKISELEDEALYKNKEEQINARYRGAAFVALSQLLFYIVLRTSRINLQQNFNPKLRQLMVSDGVPDQIQDLLDDIKNEINYNAIYKYEVFPHIPDSASGTIKEIIKNLEGLSNELVIQHDLIGLLFQRLIPFDLRKKLAAYYTKPLAAELLTRLTFETGDETVIDPACGSGTLLVHSYLQKRLLKGIDAKHKKLFSEIAGSDISVFATILASVNLAIQAPGKWTNKVNIFNENAFYLPRAQIERYLPNSIFLKKFKVQTSDGTEVVERSGLIADIVIMNPPFTRGSRLSQEERKILLKTSKIYNLKHGWRDWNLYASFILLAPEFLKVGKNGKISLVLPRSAISTQYMEGVWEKLFMQTNLGVKYIINASLTEISFSDSSEQEILIVLQKGYKKPCNMIQLIKELREYDIEDLVGEIKKIENSSKFPINSEYFEGHQIDQKDFQAMKSREWSFTAPGILELIQKDFIPSDELNFVIVGAGNSSKPVDYFWIPNKYWNLESETDREIQFKQTFDSLKLINNIRKLDEIFPDKKIPELFNNLPRDLNDEIRKDLGKIPEAIWFLFEKIPRNDLRKLLNKIPEIISIPKKYLVKSLVRNLKDIGDQPPLFNDNYPYIFFLNYSEISKNPNEDYFLWGELLKNTLASWVCAPPRTATIFFPVKIRLNTMKTIAFKSPVPLDSARMAGIIFIPINANSETREKIELLFGYLTSSIFLFDYIKKARVVSGALRQLFATDLKALMKFPNFSRLSYDDKKVIIELSKNHNENLTLKNRPIFAELISNAIIDKDGSTLRKLDEAIFKAIKIPTSILDTFYKDILKELSTERIK